MVRIGTDEVNITTPCFFNSRLALIYGQNLKIQVSRKCSKCNVKKILRWVLLGYVGLLRALESFSRARRQQVSH
jgi:hypothetical protein